MRKFLGTLLLLSLITTKGLAQKVDQLSVAATTEAIGLPFTNYLPIHPGLELKVTLKTKETKKNKQSFNANLGGYFHRKLETAFYLGPEYQYTQKLFNQKLGLDFPVGLGYLHTFYPADLYEQTESGDFEVVTQFGRPHLYVNLGVGLTYLGSKRIQPFIRQELFIETPFANGFPLIPHSLLKIGLNIKLENNDN